MIMHIISSHYYKHIGRQNISVKTTRTADRHYKHRLKICTNEHTNIYVNKNITSNIDVNVHTITGYCAIERSILPRPSFSEMYIIYVYKI